MRKMRILSLLLCVAMLVGIYGGGQVSAAVTSVAVTSVAEKWVFGQTIDTAENLLASASTTGIGISGVTSGHNNTVGNYTNGLEAGRAAMTDGNAGTKGTYYWLDSETEVGYGDVTNQFTNDKVSGTSSFGKIAFDLGAATKIEKVFVAGSSSDNVTNTWGVSSETSAQDLWGENYTLSGSNYFAAESNGGALRNFYDKRLQYYEVYVSNDTATLFAKDNCVFYFDNSKKQYDGAMHHLKTVAEGRYVGFRMTCGSNRRLRIGEVGVYAPEKATQTVAYMDGDAIPTISNLLASSTIVSGSSANQSNGGYDKALTAMTDGNANTKGTFYANYHEDYHADVVNPVTGQSVVGTTGMTRIAFDLGASKSIAQLFVMGSPSDSAGSEWSRSTENEAQSYWGDNYKLFGSAYHRLDADGNKSLYNNKHILYYEVYVSNDTATLFDTANRVLSYENTDTLYIGATHVLGEAVSGQYVGFRATTGTSTLARIGELGVYGTPVESMGKAFFANLGGQVRSAEGAATTDLRFGFEMTASGVDYELANEDDRKTSKNYSKKVDSAAKVTVDGVDYQLKDFGALVSLDGTKELTFSDVDNEMTKDVQANNLYFDNGDLTTFTAVVVGIPETNASTPIYVRPYAKLVIGGAEYIVYGEKTSRTVSDCNRDSYTKV